MVKYIICHLVIRQFGTLAYKYCTKTSYIVYLFHLDKIETLCNCRLMRKNEKEAKENEQMKLIHLKCKCP
jgi:hypothetical protein